MKVIKRTTHSVEHNGIEFNLSFGPESEPIIQEAGEKIIVGYLVKDGDCPNPLEDCDGMGHIKSLSRGHSNFIDPVEAHKAMDTKEAVPLSYFEHGQCLWDVMAGEQISRCPDMQWDGVQYAGVWVPDKSTLESCPFKTKKARAKWFREQAAIACREYTSWCNGDCWCVCVDVFDKSGERTSDDACWGYIGSDYAEKTLKEQMHDEADYWKNRDKGPFTEGQA